jgi:hypothetical protein
MSGTISQTSHADETEAHYASVPAMTIEVEDQVIPDGEIWLVIRFVGNAVYAQDAEVSLVWDRGGAAEKLIASTHGDADIPLAVPLVGDGVKKLAIVLDNSPTAEHTLGGVWEVQKQ